MELLRGRYATPVWRISYECNTSFLLYAQDCSIVAGCDITEFRIETEFINYRAPGRLSKCGTNNKLISSQFRRHDFLLLYRIIRDSLYLPPSR